MWLCSSSTSIIEDRDLSAHLNILTIREYWLDWFHITKRITVMKQMAKGLANEQHAPAETSSPQAEAPAQKSIEKELQSLKWNLWHGNVERAWERIEDLLWSLESTIGKSENQTSY